MYRPGMALFTPPHVRRIFSRAATQAGFLLLLCAGCYRHTTPQPKPEGTLESSMVLIPGGTFTMGDRTGEPSEHPERAIQLSPFRIDRTEVTNEAYQTCVVAAVCDPSAYERDPILGQAKHPAVGMAFFDAQKFCQYVGKRLPTEAEWEFAARGSTARKWPWGLVFDPSLANSRDQLDGFEKTAPVGSFPKGASPFGLFDMAGNVAEWTRDYFSPTEYRERQAAIDPTGPTQGRNRVVRGGSWTDGPYRLRATSRISKGPTEVDAVTGFRCATAGN